MLFTGIDLCYTGTMEYELIRSNRKTIAAEIKQNRLIIRAPRFASEATIRRFLKENQHWIETHVEQAHARQALADATPKLTEENVKALAKAAKRVIPARVAYFAPQVGVTYNRIAIRTQRSKWGSCSSLGNLNFNCLLMLAPPEVLDSVVVHELCHRKEMNHSKAFYAEVLRVFPDYKKWNKWLKENGPLLLMRLPE